MKEIHPEFKKTDRLLESDGVELFNKEFIRIGHEAVEFSAKHFEGIRSQFHILYELYEQFKLVEVDIRFIIKSWILKEFDVEKMDKVFQGINQEDPPEWFTFYLKDEFFIELLLELYTKYPESAFLQYYFNVKNFKEQQNSEEVEVQFIIEDIFTLSTIRPEEFNNYLNRFVTLCSQSQYYTYNALITLKQLKEAIPDSLLLSEIQNGLIKMLSNITNEALFYSLLAIIVNIENIEGIENKEKFELSKLIFELFYAKSIGAAFTMRRVQTLKTEVTARQNAEINKILSIPYFIDKLIYGTLIENPKKQLREMFNHSYSQGLDLLCYLSNINPISGKGINNYQNLSVPLKFLWQNKLYEVCDSLNLNGLTINDFEEPLVAKVFIMHIKVHVKKSQPYLVSGADKKPQLINLLENIAQRHPSLMLEIFECILACFKVSKGDIWAAKYYGWIQFLYQALVKLFELGLVRTIIEYFRKTAPYMKLTFLHNLVKMAIGTVKRPFKLHVVECLLPFLYLFLVRSRPSQSDPLFIKIKSFLNLARVKENYQDELNSNYATKVFHLVRYFHDDLMPKSLTIPIKL